MSNRSHQQRVHIWDEGIFRRFYHANPESAVDGFVNLIRGYSSESDYVVVACDSAGRTWRHELLESYKSNRTKSPEERLALDKARAECRAACAEFAAVLAADGWEADDIIATVAKRAIAEGFDVTVISGDKDLAQLIPLGVKCYDGWKDVTAETVRAKFGIDVEQLGDYLAIIGDSTDCIPGVPKLGPKAAQIILAEHGSLAYALAYVESGLSMSKVEEKLLANASLARLSRQLVGLRVDVPVEMPWIAIEEQVAHVPERPELPDADLLDPVDPWFLPNMPVDIAVEELKALEPAEQARIAQGLADIAAAGDGSEELDSVEELKVRDSASQAFEEAHADDQLPTMDELFAVTSPPRNPADRPKLESTDRPSLVAIAEQVHNPLKTRATGSASTTQMSQRKRCTSAASTASRPLARVGPSFFTRERVEPTWSTPSAASSQSTWNAHHSRSEAMWKCKYCQNELPKCTCEHPQGQLVWDDPTGGSPMVSLEEMAENRKREDDILMAKNTLEKLGPGAGGVPSHTDHGPTKA